MFSFLVLLLLAAFSVMSIRERRAFWRSRPSWILTSALIADAVIGSLIGLVGIGELAPLHPTRIAVTAAYAAVCCLGPNDWIKTGLIARFWAEGHRPVP